MEDIESINNLDVTQFSNKMIYGECYVRKGLIISRDKKNTKCLEKKTDQNF